MSHRHRAIAALVCNAFGVTAPETADIPARAMVPVDCEACKHRLQRDGGHCYMFKEKPGPYCAQFKRNTGPAAQAKEAALVDQVAAIRAETARRRAENFAKRQPKGKTN